MVRPVLTPSEMGAADRRTIDAGTPVDVLMDRAGRAVAWAVRRRVDGVYGRRAVVVCGKGNNGGDGHVTAAVLAGWGMRVERVDLPGDADGSSVDRALDRADVLVDAMYGTGFSGTLDGLAAHVASRSASVPTIAVDIPSGIDGSTGQAAGEAVHAELTVTFAAPKPGLLFEPGRSHAGEVVVADIGIDVGDVELGVTVDGDARAWLRAGGRPADTNKWRAGLLVVGGSGGMTGAPLFVSHAAMRAGAGIVWCEVPGPDAAARASGTEVIMKALPATSDGALSDAGTVLAETDRFRAIAVGPGLGTAPATREAVRALVLDASLPMVLDADGLNAFAGDAAALTARPGPTILTPHEGEYARLAGRPVGDDRVAAARALAATSGCVTLLKGSSTVVADPGGRALINLTGGPELATAGSGDVLTGIIGGFLARGLDPFTAAAAAAYVHGRAGQAAGHTGVVAGDVLAALPRTLEALTGPPRSLDAD